MHYDSIIIIFINSTAGEEVRRDGPIDECWLLQVQDKMLYRMILRQFHRATSHY